MNPKQFDFTSINKMPKEESWNGKTYYWFDCAMVSACRPIFDDCDSNYDVETILKENKVITPKNETDSESCALVVIFATKQEGEAFIKRMNKFLMKRYAEQFEGALGYKPY